MRTRSMTTSTCDWIHCLQSLMFFMMCLSVCWMFDIFLRFGSGCAGLGLSDLGPFGGDTPFRQINAGLALVRGIITYPEQSIPPNQTGITAVAAGSEFGELLQFACLCVQPRHRGANHAL